MSYLDFMNFDLSAVIDFLKEVGIAIIQAPIKLISRLPDWFKTTVFLLILAASIAIAIWWWKNRDEWRKHKRI